MAGKPELVEKIAAESGLTKAVSAKALDSVVSVIISTLASGEPVALSGFGTFKVSSTKARMGRNPATREPMEIKASKRVSFSSGSKLNSAVKG